MKFEDTVIAKKDKLGLTAIESIDKKGLTLCDPITQICKRIEAFFKSDSDITCRFIVNNHKELGPKIDPDTGEQITKQIIVEGETIEALVEQDHYCEFRIFCSDYEKAQCLSNVIRHRHKFEEIYQGTEEGEYHVREHYLIVHVCTIDAIDPDGEYGGSNPWITDDDTNSGVTEIFGLEPIDWNDIETGCNDRLSPLDTSESDIPKGFPDEYEQEQWEINPNSCAWKWKWLKKALEGNKNIINTSHEFYDGMNTWRFIECNYLPVVFNEDNLTSITGYNSILPADLLPLIFAVFGKFQIGTYARRN